MCGIAAIVGKGEFVPAETDLRGMLRRMAHRGPDAEGAWAWQKVLLGHRRLSIIDTAACSHQPMHYRDFSIVFNGEIYNYIELRDELRRAGHLFQTHSDTEVLLHAYEQWGEACLDRLRGMWAFIICDRKRHVLFCARDCFGIKPFYYRNEGRFLAVASEIAPLLSLGGKPRADMQTLANYLVSGLEDCGDRTFFDGILQLPPGHKALLEVRTASLRVERYYSLPAAAPGTISAAGFRQRLLESIRLHLRSDVPVGTCLSGGLDSSVVAAAASGFHAETAREPFAAVTGQPESEALDESRYAAQVVAKYGLAWHTVKPDYGKFARDIEKCLRHQGEPVGSPSVFLQYCVMEKAREAGLKVMLDGQGGDEILLGYERYHPIFLRMLLSQGRLLALARESLAAVANAGLSPWQLAFYTLYFLLDPMRSAVLARRHSFLTPAFLDAGLTAWRTSVRSYRDTATLQSDEISRFQLGHLLRYEDRNSMAHSIEARVPYVDRPTIEAALALPDDDKIRWGFRKYALRTVAASMLPRAIAWRRVKRGVEVYTEKWFICHRPFMQALVDGSPILRDICATVPDLELAGASMAWRLYNVALWETQFDVGRC